jgi:hypothetical protein
VRAREAGCLGRRERERGGAYQDVHILAHGLVAVGFDDFFERRAGVDGLRHGGWEVGGCLVVVSRWFVPGCMAGWLLMML